MATIEQLGDGIADPRRFAQLIGEECESNQKKQVKYGLRWLVEIVIIDFLEILCLPESGRMLYKIKINIYNRILCVQRG